MSRQTILLTSHKGVDLHAASALLVMKDRLVGGDQLEALFRCELHTYWDNSAGVSMAKLLDTGRYFNPNKHSYGHFELTDAGQPWAELDTCPGKSLNQAWPGAVLGTDLTELSDSVELLYNRLLGGPVPDGCSACDVVAFPLGQDNPVISGVVWRMIVRANQATANAVGEKLAIARHRKEGLLINPHMEGWLL